MTFTECVTACAGEAELVREFDRLQGTHLSTFGRRSGLDAAIDEATGRDVEAMQRFTAFVFTCIWVPLVAKVGE